jgi:hypothetical protein
MNKKFVQLPFGTRENCAIFAAALIAADFRFQFSPNFPQFKVDLSGADELTAREFEKIVAEHKATAGDVTNIPAGTPERYPCVILFATGKPYYSGDFGEATGRSNSDASLCEVEIDKATHWIPRGNIRRVRPDEVNDLCRMTAARRVEFVTRNR